jgi:hypothetical protein
MLNSRLGINRIFGLLFLGLSYPLFAQDWDMALSGSYSAANTMYKNSLSAYYGITTVDYAFTDYGGQFYRRGWKIEPGIALGIYSSVGGRGLVQPTAEVPLTATHAAGSAATFASGEYRLALAWTPLQIRGRAWLYRELIYAEGGMGPAYGFGAAQYKSQIISGTTIDDNRYHKYSEWGWLTSMALGVRLAIFDGVAIHIFAEGAHIYAKIQNPDLTKTGSITWSQFFVRPGMALVFRF